MVIFLKADTVVHHGSPTVPACVPNGEEHEDVAVRDDAQRDEEDKTAEHQRVALVRWSRRHIIPCARSHETFRNIRTCPARKQQMLHFTIEQKCVFLYSKA